MIYRSFIFYHSKYHWDLINIEWYFKFSMIYRSFIFYHSKYHWDLINIEWYFKFSMIYRSFIFYHSKYHCDLINIEWYFKFSMIYRSFIFYHSKYHWDLINIEWYFKFSMIIIPFVYFLPFKVPLRPTNLPLMYQWFWTVLNGTDRYWMVLNGIWMVGLYRWPILIRFFTIQIYHYDPIITPLALSMVRYWMVFSVCNGIPFVYLLSFKIPYWDLINIEWYFKLSIIYRSFIFYHSKYHWKIYLWCTNVIERFRTVPNGIEWYWMVFEWYTVGRFWWDILL